jgi:DNA-binding MarR family transcriptional regulator
MSADARNDAAACARAWQALRLAHDRVARRLDDELSRDCSLTISEFDALLCLRSRQTEPQRLSALLDAVPLSQPALSRLAARLEARGLLTRTQAENDGRSSVISLTTAGAELADRAIETHARVVRETLISRLSEDEQAALLRALSRIAT